MEKKWSCTAKFRAEAAKLLVERTLGHLLLQGHFPMCLPRALLARQLADRSDQRGLHRDELVRRLLDDLVRARFS